MNLSIFSGKRIYLWLHLGIWLIILILPLLFIYTSWGNNTAQIGRYFFRILSYGAIFYISYFWIVPRFFFLKNKIWYLAITIAIIVFFNYFILPANDLIFPDSTTDLLFRHKIETAAQELDIPKPPFKAFHLINFLLTSFLAAGLAVGLRLSGKYAENEEIRKELEKEKLTTELTFLKDQISPHFFFNTLNNIYSLIEIDAGDAQRAVLHLSKMMRYLLYESDHGRTQLSRELEFMKNYIDLMKLRLSSRIDLQVSFPEKTNNMDIPPLLFIPFIENAFKYGVGYSEKSFIHLSLDAKGGNITFKSVNSRSKKVDENHTPHSGIGLENVQKRLNLLYPDRPNLKIDQNDQKFEVLLTIQHANQYV
jgi:two-component system, LytTR family, sensor kinase